MFQLTLWSIPPLIAALVTVSLLLHAQSLRNAPGVTAFKLLLAIVLVWCGTDFLDSIITDKPSTLLLAKLRMSTVAMSPVAWFAFALSFATRRARPPRAAMNAVCVIPLITICLVATSSWHSLIWSEFVFSPADAYVSLVVTHGAWFYAHAAYSYMLIFGASMLLAFALHQGGHSKRSVTAVLLAPLMVGLANAYSVSSYNATPWFDLSTMGFAIALMLLDKWVLSDGLLESHPVIRDRVVEELNEGVIVINAAGSVIDINKGALQILDTDRASITNAPIEQYITSIPLTSLNSRQKANLELTLNERAYHVTSTLLDSTSDDSDTVFVLRDVTIRREAEQRLRNMQAELEEMAHTDALTKLVNRRLFLSRLVEEVERVRRHGSTLSVLLFDLDHFKAVNDTFGHDAGDRVLRTVARIATQVKRVTDVAARIGGEEFALLLPETKHDGATHLASRLRESIEEASTLSDKGRAIQVTASIGVATVTQDHRTLDNVLQLADSALYKAKDGGRNRICSADTM